MKKGLLLILALVAHSAIAKSEIERYGALPVIQQMTISPNGEQVAYRGVSGEQDTLSVVDVKSGERLAVIDLSSIKPRSVKFLNDENLVLKMANTKKAIGFTGMIEFTTAATIDLKKGDYSHLLVPGKDNVYTGQSSLHKIVGVSPDGEWVYMPAYEGDAKFIGGQQIMPPMSLFKVKIGGSGRALVHKRGRGQVIDFFVDNEGEVLVREVFDENEDKHSLFVYKGQKSVEIFSENTPYRTKDVIGLSADQTQLFMLDSNNDTNRWAIYSITLDDGKIEGPLYDRDDADIVGHFTNQQRQVFGVEYSGFTPSYRFFDADLNQRVQTILANYPKHSVSIVEVSPDRNHVLVQVEGNQYAGEYYLYSKGKKAVFVSKSRPQIPVEEIHPIVAINYTARDGITIPTLVTIPRSRADSLSNLPAIIMPHGGPESFDAIGFDYFAQALAQQGYLVIQPQFRGSVGFGLKHQAAGYGEWGRKSLFDLSDAITYFSSQKLIDKNRVCIVGASYGGYSALAGGAFESDLYQCVVSINGIGNLPDMLARTRTEQGSSSSSLAFWEAQIIGFGEKDPDVAKQRSPELSALAFKAPVLLIHSEKDKVVHPRQSVTMYRALKDAGKTVEIVELEGEDHYLSHGATRLQALSETIEFVNKHISM